MSLEDAVKVSDQVMKSQDHVFDLEAKRARLRVELIEAQLRIELQMIANANKRDKLLAARKARSLAMTQIKEIHKARTRMNARVKNFENWRLRAERLLFPDVMESKYVTQSWNAWFKLIGLWPTQVKKQLGELLVPDNVKRKEQFKFHRKTAPKKFRGRSAMSLWMWCKNNGVTVQPGTKAMKLFYKSFASFGKSVATVGKELKAELAVLQKELDKARDQFIKENLPPAEEDDNDKGDI